MEVTYSVAVDQAVRNLELINKKMDESTEKTEEQTEADKGRQVSLKQATKVWAVMGAVATGALYGIIKASSYAAIYTAQFGATSQQLANVFMGRTGINKAIEDFNREFQLFTDRIEEGDTVVQSLIKSLITLGKWFGEQTSLIQFLVLLGGLSTAIGLIIGTLGALGLAGAAVSSGWAVLAGAAAFLAAKFVLAKIALAKIVTWFAAGSTGAIALGATIGALIGLIVVWGMEVTGISDKIIALGESFRKWESWIKDIITIAASPFVIIGSGIRDIVNGDFSFTLLQQSLILTGDSFKNLANIAIDAINSIISAINRIPNVNIGKLGKFTPSFGGFGGGSSGGEGFGGSWGEGTVNDAIITPSGQVIKTDPKDYLIATQTPGSLINSVDNNPIINNIEIINNAASISGKFVDDPANVNATSIEEIKNNLQGVVDWIQINVIDKSANWGMQTIINMKEGILSDGMFPYIIPNRIIVGIDNLISLSHSMGLNVITEFKGGINELLDDTTAIIPIGMITAFQQIVDSSYNYGAEIAKEIQRGLSSVRLSVTVYKKIVTTSSGGGGSPSAKYRTGVHDAIIAPGGRIITTHPKDFLIATKNPGELVGGSNGGDTYNIAPIINITTSGGSGMAADISRQVSKAIAEEVRRITKV